jgi:hypothetical protein
VSIVSDSSVQPGHTVSQPQVASSDELRDDSEDEEDEFEIDLTAQIQNVELDKGAANMGALVVAEEDTGGSTTNREGGSDPATRRVVASISTLALYLQRSKPHEWNELIQVVLQGVMLVKSTSITQQTEGTAAKNGHAHLC